MKGRRDYIEGGLAEFAEAGGNVGEIGGLLKAVARVRPTFTVHALGITGNQQENNTI